VGLGSSAWRTSLNQCVIGGSVRAIGCRHLTTWISAVSTTSPSRYHGSTGVLSLSSFRSHGGSSLRTSPSLLTRRHNSSNVPSKSTDKSTVTTTASSPQELEKKSPAPSNSILSRLSGLISLKGAQTTGETGYSSVAKLVELAKPEKKQLAMAVGLVRLFQRYVLMCSW
jgi:hypothetical protein